MFSATWACCDDTSFHDDDHNIGNTFLLLCADALITPLVFAGLTDVDELKVALGFRFAVRCCSAGLTYHRPGTPGSWLGVARARLGPPVI